MKKHFFLAVLAGVGLFYGGCGDKHKKRSYEALCISDVLEDENFKSNPNSGAIAKDICRCSEATFAQLTERSKSEYMALLNEGTTAHLSDPKDEAALKAALTDCAMQAVVHQLQSSGE